MSLFKKLIDETQMPKAQECTDNYIFTKKLFLAGLRGLQSISNPVERPCILLLLAHQFCKIQAAFGRRESSIV